MNDAQLTLLTMYKDVKNILDTNGITFYAHFGTALGAVRHEGLIPWDDDIDIAVWEDDLGRINRVLSENLDRDRYFYHVPSADTHPHIIAKTENFKDDLANKKAPFIDIFVISGYPSSRGRKLICDMSIWICVCSIWAIDRIGPIPIHKAVSWIPRTFRRIADMTVNRDSDLTVIYATTFKDYIFDRKWYGTPVGHTFEDTDVPLPEEWDRMLASLYGDYMTPPPEDRRTGASGFPCSAYKDYIMNEREHNGRT